MMRRLMKSLAHRRKLAIIPPLKCRNSSQRAHGQGCLEIGC